MCLVRNKIKHWKKYKIGKSWTPLGKISLSCTSPVLDSIYLAGSMAISKHVPYYGLWSDFPYYNLTTPNLQPGDALCSSVGQALGTCINTQLKFVSFPAEIFTL
jgi:hypothetical protein